MKTDSTQSQRETDKTGEGRSRAARYALVLALGIGLALAWHLAASTRTLLTAGLEALLAWSFLVGVAHILYPRRSSTAGEALPPASHDSWLSFPYTGQALVLAFAVLWLINLGAPALRYPAMLGTTPVEALRLAATALLVYAVLLSFLAQYARFLQSGGPASFGGPVIHLSRLTAVTSGFAALFLFVFLSVGWDFGNAFGEVLLGLTLVLVVESGVRMCSRFFLPPSLRRTPAPLGSSVFLDLLTGSANGWRALAAELETVLGTKLSELWILQFLRDAAVPALVGLALLGWLSTCLTAVPLGSRGVLETMGRFAPQPLPPGLHATLPWPLQRIEIVPTECVQEISLGFEQDLSGPLLWTEKHYTGEHNLLIDGGESLLVIDVPVQFRVADPVAYLQASSDPVAALRSLAERELIRLAQGQSGFDIMTQSRAAIAAGLQTALQRDADRLGLGLEVIFVGLKDVHPPVEVAPAYEKVVSAQETEAATIDEAKAYTASQIPDAQAQAQRLTLEADANATQRTDLATGEAASFTALVSARAESPALFGLRLRYDALSEGLPGPNKYIVGFSGETKLASYLNLRAPGTPGSASVAPPPQQAPAPPPGRTTPAEVPEH